MNKDEKFKLISHMLPFWSKLTNDEKNMLINNSIDKSFKSGDNIFNGDINCIGLLLIKSGQVRIYIVSEDGREITLYRLGSEELCVLSASCVINSINFDVNIDVVEDTNITVINSKDFAQLCNNNIHAENFSNKIIADRFSKVMWVMEQILFMRFDKRLAIFLLEETDRNNSDTLQYTHEQIAKFTSSAREVVSRMLKYFEKEGIIKLSRSKIQIVNRNQLKKYT